MKGKQVSVNLLFNIINLLSNILIGLWLTPYLLNTLGAVAYGLIPLTLIINKYINVATISLTSSFTRFYAMSFQKEDFTSAKKYFNTSFFSILILFILISPVIYLGILNINQIINIPENLVEDAVNLFSLTVLSLFISIFSSLFNTALYAKNRLEVINLFKIIKMICKAALIFICFNFVDVSVMWVGLATVLSELIVLVVSIYFFYKLTPEIQLSLKDYDKTKLFLVLSMSFWVIIHELGDISISSVDVFFINRHFGVQAGGSVGAISEWNTFVTSGIAVLTSLSGPLILIAYAKVNHEKIQQICLINLKYISLIVAILAGLITGFSEVILKLWLGEEYVRYSLIFTLKIFSLIFSLSVGGYFFVFRAWNKVMIPAVVTIVCGILNLLTLYFFSKWYDVSDVFIVSVCIMFLVIQSFGLGVVYYAHIYNIKVISLLRPFIASIICYFLIYFFVKTLSSIAFVQTWIQLISSCSIIGFVTTIALYKWYVSNSEKKELQSLLPHRLTKYLRWLD